ncbi:hypothetical protein KUCAC02_011474 [Chaenocephalus aceratus]|uniref:Uncharacterized protein n=1 Tax=Chaenocephalus aceratus TaxID=36190 RepID=A0ACB9WWU9_CHAAC|nr:hypothetical protein KUCAC02_011474 [Chaenocephalus aceratus]
MARDPQICLHPNSPRSRPQLLPPPSVPHGPSNNGNTNGHNGSSRRGMMSDEAKATILHLRESLVRQKETILDQRETIRELTAKLTLCETFGGHHGTDHHENRHDNHHDTHDNHHDDHHDDHHGPHSTHHTPSSSHHGTYHPSDHHYPHGRSDPHRSDPHSRKGMSYGKHSSFSPEQTGKTLQTLKERLESLQARNSSSSLLQLPERTPPAEDHRPWKSSCTATTGITMTIAMMTTTTTIMAASTPKTTMIDHHGVTGQHGTGHNDNHHVDHQGPGHRNDHHDEHHGNWSP